MRAGACSNLSQGFRRSSTARARRLRAGTPPQNSCFRENYAELLNHVKRDKEPAGPKRSGPNLPTDRSARAIRASTRTKRS